MNIRKYCKRLRSECEKTVEFLPTKFRLLKTKDSMWRCTLIGVDCPPEFMWNRVEIWEKGDTINKDLLYAIIAHELGHAIDNSFLVNTFHEKAILWKELNRDREHTADLYAYRLLKQVNAPQESLDFVEHHILCETW